MESPSYFRDLAVLSMKLESLELLHVYLSCGVFPLSLLSGISEGKLSGKFFLSTAPPWTLRLIFLGREAVRVGKHNVYEASR